jgi:hypothetical protein
MIKTASAAQAAAITAAIQYFAAQSGVNPGRAVEPVRPWQRAALVEGVGAKGTVYDRKGGARWLW